MRKILFTTVAVVMLLSLFVSSAFAQDGVLPDPPWWSQTVYEAQLGEVWYHYYPNFVPGERVDAYMYRPTIDEFGPVGWPDSDAQIAADGAWWWEGPASQVRRQSWPTYQYADEWGYYFTEFMLPRDEVWYPCSFPLKWKCNYAIDPSTIEWHSPMNQSNFETGLYWPWLDYDAAANPMDTISFVEVWLVGESGAWWIIPYVIDGYYWKWTDID